MEVSRAEYAHAITASGGVIDVTSLYNTLVDSREMSANRMRDELEASFSVTEFWIKLRGCRVLAHIWWDDADVAQILVTRDP
jgi:hypothetical protein